MSHYVPLSNNVFTLAIGFRCGAINEDKKHSGISHLLEHVMFRGKKDVMKKMIQLGVKWNAVTSLDYTMYHLSCAMNNAKKACRLLLTVVSSFDDITVAEFNMEKKVVIEEISLYPDGHVNEDMFRMVHRGTPYFNSIRGTEKTLANIKLDDIKSYHARFYNRPFVTFSCPKNQIKTVEKWLGIGEVKQGDSQNIDINMNRHLSSKKYQFITICKEKDELELCRLAYLGFPKFDIRSNVASLIAFILTIRLTEQVREKKGKVYSIHIKHDAHACAGTFIMEFKTQYGNLSSILRAFKKQVDALKTINMATVKQYSERLRRYKETTDPMTMTMQRLKSKIFGAEYENMDRATAGAAGAAATISILEFSDTVKTLFDNTRLAYVCKTRESKDEIQKIFDK